MVMRHGIDIPRGRRADTVCARMYSVRSVGQNLAHLGMTFDVKAGERVSFLLAWKESHLPDGPVLR